MGRPEGREFVKECTEKVKPFGPVIDLGAGEFTNYYKPFFPGLDYITLDAQQNSTNSIDIIADLLTLPRVHDAYYGVVLLMDVLEHIEKPFTAFMKISQILSPGGIIICSTVTSWVEHDHQADYWRFTQAGLVLLCDRFDLRIFHKKIAAPGGCIPCQVMIAATKDHS